MVAATTTESNSSPSVPKEKNFRNSVDDNTKFISRKIRFLPSQYPIKFKRQRSKSSPPHKLQPVKVGMSTVFFERSKAKRKAQFSENFVEKVKAFTFNDVRVGNLLDIKRPFGQESRTPLEGLSPSLHNGTLVSGNDQSEEVTNEIWEHPSGRSALLDTWQIADVPTSGPANDSIAGNSIMAATENNTEAATTKFQDNRPSRRKSLEIIRLEDKKITLLKLPQHSSFVRVYKVNGSHILGIRKIRPSKKMRKMMFGKDKVIKPFLRPLPLSNGSVLYPKTIANGRRIMMPKLFPDIQLKKFDGSIEDEKSFTKFNEKMSAEVIESESSESALNDNVGETMRAEILVTSTVSEKTTEVNPFRTISAHTPYSTIGNEKKMPFHFKENGKIKNNTVSEDPVYEINNKMEDKMAVFVESQLQPTYVLPTKRNNNISRKRPSEVSKDCFNIPEFYDAESKENLDPSSSSEMYNSASPIDVTEASSNLSASPSTVLTSEASYQYPIFLSRKYPTTKSLVLLSRRYPFMSRDSANLSDYSPASRQHKAYYIEPGTPSIPTQQIDPTFPQKNAGRRQSHPRFKWREIALETNSRYWKPEVYLAEATMELPPRKKNNAFFKKLYLSSTEFPFRVITESYDIAESINDFRLSGENLITEENMTAVEDIVGIKATPKKISFANFKSARSSPSPSGSHSVPKHFLSSDENISRSQRESNAHKGTNAINNKNKFSRSGRRSLKISKISSESEMAQRSISRAPKIAVWSNHVNSLARSSHQTVRKPQPQKTERHRLQKELTDSSTEAQHRENFLQRVSLPKQYFRSSSTLRPPLSSAVSPGNETLNLLTSEVSDFPTYSSVPNTSFRCEGRYPGYYADLEAKCQVFHRCQQSGKTHSFLCPNGTVFSQRLLTCDRWTAVNCSRSERFYRVNQGL
ncbi:Chitin binding domain [Trinorchestia longiramus]|nr:Chitin binding domain [Trinorchestia longiramus]